MEKRSRFALIVALLLACAACQAATTERIVYRGAALGDCAMPVGGVGGGHVSICGDGAVRQWNIFNVNSEGCVVPDSFFAVWAKADGKEPAARLLQQTPIGKLPAMQAAEFVGEYPIAEVRFQDDGLPVEVSLRAFSPFIPTNAKDSAIPCAIFEITVRNKTGANVQVSLLGTLQNAVGYPGQSTITGVFNKYYGANVNALISGPSMRGALLANPSLKTDSRQPGTMAIAALERGAIVTPQWDNATALWQEFSRTGTAGSTAIGPSQDGRTWNAAVTVPMTLGPMQKKTVTYLWAWSFPNRRVYWRGEDRNTVVGNMYTNWFADAGKTVEYVATNYARLAGDTLKFKDTFYRTTLPYYMLDRISAQSSTLVSVVCMWLKDGTFAAFEGAACCPMNCTHVWNYEQQMAHLFPELDRNMRNVDFGVQQQDNGGVRHRTRIPLDAVRDSMVFADGQLGTILKAYREYRQSGDREWLNRHWPKIKRAMQYVLDDWDHDKDGVLVCWQWNTYDAAMIGPNTFIGTLYLCALRACEEMAKVEGDAEFAARMRSVFDTGSKRLDAVCWNGEYYQQIEDKAGADAAAAQHKWLLDDWPTATGEEKHNLPYGKGCHADQLLGQWWAYQLDLGYLLPKERVVSCLDAIMKHNWVENFAKVKQTPRAFAGEGDPGLYNCTWPNGGKPKQEMLYSFEVWTGIEYEVAPLMIREGRFDEACRIVKAVSDRYNGRERHPIHRNPWAEVECGNHYARAMSAWGILLAAQGYNYCGPQGHLEFNPVVSPENHASFFTTADGWGLFTQRRSGRAQENTLSLEYGTLTLNTLALHLPDNMPSAQVKLDKRFGAFSQTSDGKGKVTVEFEKPVALKAGEKIGVSLRAR